MKIVDGLRYEAGKSAMVKYTCPACKQEKVQPCSMDDTEGSLVIPLPHDGCKASNVLIRVK